MYLVITMVYNDISKMLKGVVKRNQTIDQLCCVLVGIKDYGVGVETART